MHSIKEPAELASRVPDHVQAPALAAPAASPSEALSLLAAMPPRFSLGQILEEAERRGGTARQGYIHLQAFIAEGRVIDEGPWLVKTTGPGEAEY